MGALTPPERASPAAPIYVRRYWGVRPLSRALEYAALRHLVAEMESRSKALSLEAQAIVGSSIGHFRREIADMEASPGLFYDT
jgi:hypothetical protein